jgi:O-antigen ligase
MDRERLDKWFEWTVLGLVLTILVFGPLALGAVRMSEFAIIEALTIGVLTVWLARLWLYPGSRLIVPPVCWGVLLFVAYAIGRYYYSDIEYVARQEIIRILLYALLFFAVLFHLHRQSSMMIISLVLIFLAMALSVYAIFQFATKSNYVWHFVKPSQYLNRSSGTYICPNHLCGFLEMILPLGLACTILGRVKPLTRILVGYATMVIMAGIAVTISRGGWIATGLALLVFFGILIRQPAHRWQALAALVILITLGSLFVANNRHTRSRFSAMLVTGKLEDIRFRLWHPAYQLWQENPWWGVGPAHFDYRFRQFRPEEIQMRPDRVHNDYLNTLCDYGIAGTACVVIAWSLLYWGVFRTWKHVQRQSNELSGKKGNRFPFVFGVAIGLLIILLHSFVDFNMHIPANAILTVVLMALLASHQRFATNRYWLPLKLPGRLMLSLVLLFGILFLSIQGWRSYWEDYWLEQAYQAKADPQAKLGCLKKANQIAPNNPFTADQIGEILRIQSWSGEDGYEKLAEEAMGWFAKSAALNPYYCYAYLRHGMCLDWLGRHQESVPLYEKAISLDPNGYYTLAHMGWHYVQVGDYPRAKLWFERSLKLKPSANKIATSYLEIINRKLAEQGSAASK